jgi:hypothetical protein
MVWKLLIIESFFQSKLNKIKIKNYIKIWGRFSCCLKALCKSYLIIFISKFSELLVRYWFLNVCYCKKFKQIAKIWFGRKNMLSSQCVHTWANITGYTSYIGIINLLESYHIIEVNMGLMSHVILNIKISKHGRLHVSSIKNKFFIFNLCTRDI